MLSTSTQAGMSNAMTNNPGGGWGTNTTIEQAAAFLRTLKSVCLTTHAKPDGDAIGSTVALARTLRSLGLLVTIVYVGPVPRWAVSMTMGLEVVELAPGRAMRRADGAEFKQPEADGICVLDTGSWTQVQDIRVWLAAHPDRTLMVDHHLNGNAEMATRRIVTMRAASCTEALAPLICELMRAPSAARLPLEIAEPLYLGLATDTGWLRYSSVTPTTLRLAADLIEAGVDHARLYAMIEQQDLPSRWALLGRALATLELHDGGRVATMTLSARDFQETGADRNDTSGFADMVLTVASVQLSVVLTEQDPTPDGRTITKLSLRSKPGQGAIDVNALAGRMGGGGHARAAGAKFEGAPAGAKASLLDNVALENGA